MAAALRPRPRPRPPSRPLSTASSGTNSTSSGRGRAWCLVSILVFLTTLATLSLSCAGNAEEKNLCRSAILSTAADFMEGKMSFDEVEPIFLHSRHHEDHRRAAQFYDGTALIYFREAFAGLFGDFYNQITEQFTPQSAFYRSAVAFVDMDGSINGGKSVLFCIDGVDRAYRAFIGYSDDGFAFDEDAHDSNPKYSVSISCCANLFYVSSFGAYLYDTAVLKFFQIVEVFRQAGDTRFWSCNGAHAVGITKTPLAVLARALSVKRISLLNQAHGVSLSVSYYIARFVQIMRCGTGAFILYMAGVFGSDAYHDPKEGVVIVQSNRAYLEGIAVMLHLAMGVKNLQPQHHGWTPGNKLVPYYLKYGGADAVKLQLAIGAFDYCRRVTHTLCILWRVVAILSGINGIGARDRKTMNDTKQFIYDLLKVVRKQNPS